MVVDSTTLMTISFHNP